MAKHIDDLMTCDLRRVDKAAFYAEIQPGDLVFVAGNEAISRGIQAVTKSPWSHVVFAWCPNEADVWLTLESTIERGVHVGLLSDYVEGRNEAIAIARTPGLTLADKFAAMNAGFCVLEDAYDWQQEASIVARKLLHSLPLIVPKKEYYCSGLQWFMRQHTSIPLQKLGASMPTPEDNWADVSVEAVCLLVK